MLSVPIGIAAAIYLEEFAPKNRLTDLIEVNINNLAAVPSIVFGLLGLAVFINAFGLPRSSPLVGGMVLALMTLPTIIIATRNALRAVPPSIREAAFGVGASRHQVVTPPRPAAGDARHPHRHDHRPGPRARRDRAAAPDRHERLHRRRARPRLSTPATALPIQIFIWADSPERGFAERTSAAILVLLGFLIVMNARRHLPAPPVRAHW